MNEKEQIFIKDKISYAEEFDINLFGIGLGFYPKEIKEIYFQNVYGHYHQN